MQDWIQNLPLAAAILFFWVVGIVRTSVVYLLGWIASRGGNRLPRIRHLTRTPLYRRAEAFVNRWGVLAVPACFLTLGFQTAVIVTTGFTRMPLRRWVPAMLVGTLIWGTVYGTVGMAVVWAWLERPWIGAVVVGILLLAVLAMKLWPRRNGSAGRPGAGTRTGVTASHRDPGGERPEPSRVGTPGRT